MADKVQVKIKKSFANFTEGEVVEVLGVDGVPLDVFWQRRLRDSAIDGCCELVPAAKKTKASKSSSGGSD
jgi:hypothetical protein